MNIFSVINYNNFALKSNVVFNSRCKNIAYDTIEFCGNNKKFNKVFDEAKKYVMDAVSAKEPLEACAYIMDDEIIFREMGEKYSVFVDDYFVDLKCRNSKNKITVIHSHPFEYNKQAFPVSFDDFATINDLKGVKQIYAIAPNGEYSMIKKNGFIGVSDYMLSKYEKIFSDEYYQALNDDDKKVMDEFKAIFESDEPYSVKQNAQKEYEKFIQKESVVKSEMQAIHNFWKKYEWDLDIKYETNYSYLKN